MGVMAPGPRPPRLQQRCTQPWQQRRKVLTRSLPQKAGACSTPFAQKRLNDRFSLRFDFCPFYITIPWLIASLLFFFFFISSILTTSSHLGPIAFTCLWIQCFETLCFLLFHSAEFAACVDNFAFDYSSVLFASARTTRNSGSFFVRKLYKF